MFSSARMSENLRPIQNCQAANLTLIQTFAPVLYGHTFSSGRQPAGESEATRTGLNEIRKWERGPTVVGMPPGGQPSRMASPYIPCYAYGVLPIFLAGESAIHAP